MAPLAHKANQVLQVTQVVLGQLVLLDPSDPLAHKENQVLLVTQVPLDQLDLLVLPARLTKHRRPHLTQPQLTQPLLQLIRHQSQSTNSPFTNPQRQAMVKHHPIITRILF